MPLPPLRLDGTLPPGVHVATVAEVFATFPAMTAQRQALDQALAYCVATVKRLRLADEIVLDGSYITSKPDPGDIDMVVLTPGVYQLTGERLYAAAGIDLAALDVQFTHEASDFQGWVAFFSTGRNLAPKGVVSLVL
jgi:hypothetical protein